MALPLQSRLDFLDLLYFTSTRLSALRSVTSTAVRVPGMTSIYTHFSDSNKWILRFLLQFHSYQVILLIERDPSSKQSALNWEWSWWYAWEKKGAYCTTQQMKIPAAISRTTHSVNHVIYIVILTCRLFLFLYHLHVNPIHSFLPMMKWKKERKKKKRKHEKIVILDLHLWNVLKPVRLTIGKMLV